MIARCQWRAVVVAAIATLSSGANPMASPVVAAPGDLAALTVRVRCELDLFAPVGRHTGCNVKLLAPLAHGAQVPLRIQVATEPPGELTAWHIDEEGLLSVDLADQTGEKHVGLTATFDLLVSDGVGCDDARKRSSIHKRTASGAQKAWLRPLVGAKPDDPDVAKLAATLASSAGDVLLLARAIDEVMTSKVREEENGPHDGAEALRRGVGSRLGRARLTAALALAHGVPVRLASAVPLHGGGDPQYLVELHAGELGWLRFDTLHRKAPAFPWPDVEDLVVAVIDADTPLQERARPRLFFCRGGLTAAPKNPALSYSVRELHAGTLSRAVSKELLPALGSAFAEARASQRAANDELRTLANPKLAKLGGAQEWLAAASKAIAELK